MEHQSIASSSFEETIVQKKAPVKILEERNDTKLRELVGRPTKRDQVTSPIKPEHLDKENVFPTFDQNQSHRVSHVFNSQTAQATTRSNPKKCSFDELLDESLWRNQSSIVYFDDSTQSRNLYTEPNGMNPPLIIKTENSATERVFGVRKSPQFALIRQKSKGKQESSLIKQLDSLQTTRNTSNYSSKSKAHAQKSWQEQLRPPAKPGKLNLKVGKTCTNRSPVARVIQSRNNGNTSLQQIYSQIYSNTRQQSHTTSATSLYPSTHSQSCANIVIQNNFKEEKPKIDPNSIKQLIQGEIQRLQTIYEALDQLGAQQQSTANSKMSTLSFNHANQFQ
ncbi:hypothetical protein FGO68_gene14467 [Halteria grandinella]|uniref:Uncharacterized protein n=1 Tax=Halteria grandinella TaxID=5974 RepID=A0A8J8NFH6_HALGN|nr:hypothetical protein FGO68_gene14467 [Halteria grandinella]